MILLHSVVNASNVVLRAARISREIIEKESWRVDEIALQSFKKVFLGENAVWW